MCEKNKSAKAGFVFKSSQPAALAWYDNNIGRYNQNSIPLLNIVLIYLRHDENNIQTRKRKTADEYMLFWWIIPWIEIESNLI